MNIYINMFIIIMISMKNSSRLAVFFFENTPMVPFHIPHFGIKHNAVTIMFSMNTQSVAK